MLAMQEKSPYLTPVNTVLVLVEATLLMTVLFSSRAEQFTPKAILAAELAADIPGTFKALPLPEEI